LHPFDIVPATQKIYEEDTMALRKKFNAEASLHNLTAAVEAQIDTLQSDTGPLRTLTSLAKSRGKITRSMKELAAALDVPAKGKHAYDLINELAQKSEEKNIPGAARLKQLQDWTKTFWGQEEVKKADASMLHPLKGIKTVKELAKKQPKP
jgi:hypothetical protein